MKDSTLPDNLLVVGSLVVLRRYVCPLFNCCLLFTVLVIEHFQSYDSSSILGVMIAWTPFSNNVPTIWIASSIGTFFPSDTHCRKATEDDWETNALMIFCISGEILVLNGSPKPSGNTKKLVNAWKTGQSGWGEWQNEQVGQCAVVIDIYARLQTY